METEDNVMFQPLSHGLTIADFRKITEQVNTWVAGHETPLFKHRKSLTDLAYELYGFYKLGILKVYEHKDRVGVPAGLLMYSTETFWWIEGCLLVEHLVLALTQDKGFGNFAISVMEREARSRGCVLILSGASMIQKIPKVTSVYKRRGFVVYGADYLKEVNER